MKKTAESPWWYKQEPQKFMSSSDVSLMTAEEVGSYFLLLQHAWLGGQDCSLPNEPERLARLARVPKVSDIVMSKFVVNKAGRLVNPRLSREWAEALQRSMDAKKASEKRWNKPYEGNAGAMQAVSEGISEGNATNTKTRPTQHKVSKASQPAFTSFISASHPTPTPTPLAGGETLDAAERVTARVAQVLGVNLSPAWTNGARALLVRYPEAELTGALEWAARSDYWVGDGFMENPKKITQRIDTIVQQYRDDTKPKREKRGSRKRGDSHTGKMKWSPSVNADPANPTKLRPSIA